MRSGLLRLAGRCAAGTLLLALLCLAPTSRLATPPAFASTVRLHYEDAFDDVQATKENEVAIKAAFLLRFPDFISWRKTPGDTLRIGVTGDDELFNMLTLLAEQENQSGLGGSHVIAVGQITNPDEARHCEILVLGDAGSPESLPSLTDVHSAGCLTVGVWGKPRGGTVMRLFRDDNRVRFSISQALAKEAGLQISSKLLNLAREQSNQLLPDTLEPARG